MRPTPPIPRSAPRWIQTSIWLIPPQKIIESGDVRFGPLMKDLTHWALRMAVVNGVRVKTANHETGFRQILRFRTGVSPAMPGLFGSSASSATASRWPACRSVTWGGSLFAQSVVWHRNADGRHLAARARQGSV